MGSPRGSVGRDRGDAAGRANAGQKETGSPPNDPTSASVGELVVECARGNEKLCRLVATGLHSSDRQLCSPHRECGCLDHPLGTRGARPAPAARPLLLDAAGRAAHSAGANASGGLGSRDCQHRREYAGGGAALVGAAASSPQGRSSALGRQDRRSVQLAQPTMGLVAVSRAWCGPTAKWKCSACWKDWCPAV